MARYLCVLPSVWLDGFLFPRRGEGDSRQDGTGVSKYSDGVRPLNSLYLASGP